jgi:hypothetical protein
MEDRFLITPANAGERQRQMEAVVKQAADAAEVIVREGAARHRTALIGARPPGTQTPRQPVR